MPAESAAAAHKRLLREAARRREAVNLLRIAECMCRYAASELGNGLGPAEARAAAAEAAGELAMVAESLRRLTRLGPAERRARAVQLAALGWSKHRVAVALGVSDRAVQAYSRPRSPAGPGNSTAGDLLPGSGCRSTPLRQ